MVLSECLNNVIYKGHFPLKQAQDPTDGQWDSLSKGLG
jgi:hypothetical protein